MKQLICLLLFIFFTAFPQFSSAQNCNQGKKLAENTWEKWGPWKPNISLIPFKNEVTTLRNYWNWIASNGVGTVGPRRLEVGEGNEEGTIHGQTQSTFVTPPVFEDNIEITINKYDGKAETDVVICIHERNGNLNQVHEYTFPNENNARVKKFTIDNARGKIVIVAMKNKSVGNRFMYRIKAD